jgi:hypothetical protein
LIANAPDSTAVEERRGLCQIVGKGHPGRTHPIAQVGRSVLPPRRCSVFGTCLFQGDANMGDKGSKDKAKKEKQKKAVLSPKEKRRQKNEKKNNQ